VAVYAPGYGYYHGGHQVKVYKAHKDTARIASGTKEAATPAVEATAKAPETAPSDAAPEK
jgi:hypothetical protein